MVVSDISADAAPLPHDQGSNVEHTKQPEALTEQSKSGGEERQTAATTAAGAGERRTGQDCEDDTANDTGSNVDPEEREKLERRRRRRPTVNLERYLNNTDDEGERKEHGGAGSTRSLVRAIMQEDVAEFMHLVQEEGATCVFDTDAHGWSPLHWACSRGSTALTYAVLQEMQASQEAASSDREGPTDANSLDYLNARETLNGWTPLHLACISGKLDVVYLLMEAGSNPAVKDKVGDRPINCIRRARNRGKLAERLRNALLDLTDTEDSDSERGGT